MAGPLWSNDEGSNHGKKRQAENEQGAVKAPRLVVSCGKLDAKRFPAAAAVFFAWVVELEALVEAFAHKVELGAFQVGQAFRVNQHLHAMVLKDHVFGRHVVSIFKLIGQA